MKARRGRTAVVGLGQTPFYKRGTAPEPELKLCLRAIVSACESAGIDPRDVDGFVSYGSDRNDAAKLMAGLGTREIRFAALNWAHGGGIPGAVGVAAAGVIAGQADIVVVYRAMAEDASGRLRVAVAQNDTASQYLVNGLDGPMQICAMRTMRLFEVDGVPRSAQRAMVMAAYHHARRNPDAYGRGTALDDEMYEASRWVAEPYHLFDCSRENDAAFAVVLVGADRAKDFADRPAYVLAAPTGIDRAWGGAVVENHEPYTSSGLRAVGRRLWADSGFAPTDVDVTQVYENAAGQGIGALIDLGFCDAVGAADFFQFEKLIAPSGSFPVNTSGGNLAEGFIHGMSLVNEAVRQIRGQSCNQVPDVSLSLMTGGPGDTLVSAALFGSEATAE